MCKKCVTKFSAGSGRPRTESISSMMSELRNVTIQDISDHFVNRLTFLFHIHPSLGLKRDWIQTSVKRNDLQVRQGAYIEPLLLTFKKSQDADVLGETNTFARNISNRPKLSELRTKAIPESDETEPLVRSISEKQPSRALWSSFNESTVVHSPRRTSIHQLPKPSKAILLRTMSVGISESAASPESISSPSETPVGLLSNPSPALLNLDQASVRLLPQVILIMLKYFPYLIVP